MHQLVKVNAGDGDGEKSDGGEHAVPPADVVGYGEGLIAFGIGKGFERAAGAVRRCVNARGGAGFPVLPLQLFAEEAERDGGLGRRAGL